MWTLHCVVLGWAMARGEGSRSVRVFTVANESRYVVVRNVPALGVIDDLLKRLSLYGKVCEYRLLDHPDDRHAALQHVPSETHAEAVAASDDDAEHQFTDVVWVQYETVNNARHAKVRGVQKPFFGSRLQISYAPQFESRADTATKLAQRRQLLQRRARPASTVGFRVDGDPEGEHAVMILRVDLGEPHNDPIRCNQYVKNANTEHFEHFARYSNGATGFFTSCVLKEESQTLVGGQPLLQLLQLVLPRCSLLLRFY
ncbi:hypothetical protein BBJ28_00016769 [Nothophytophthora sp. Chile5]|nr:hypothetical protein BBJ28_00016769 [Nothophytophthora sp. Chile5]